MASGKRSGLCKYVDTSSVPVVDVFVDEIDLGKLGFDGVVPVAPGRPAYLPAVLLNIYIYGYLNCFQSSCRLEREAYSNSATQWLATLAMRWKGS